MQRAFSVLLPLLLSTACARSGSKPASEQVSAPESSRRAALVHAADAAEPIGASQAGLVPPVQQDLVQIVKSLGSELTPYRSMEPPRGKHGAPVAPATWLKNPTSKNRFPVYLQLPKGKGPFPALVMVPAGLQSGNLALLHGGAEFLQEGFAVISFDPEGRGSAEGEEDFGGTISQDALAAVLGWVKTQSEVDSQRIGVFSGSFGITMATGALARYPTAARFLLDWEGPPSREYVGCKVYHKQPNRMGWGGCDDESWWQPREAIRFIGHLRVPYWRVQTEVGHAQPEPRPALEMIQAARKGGVPMVGVNHMEADPRLGSVSDIVLISETLNEEREYARIARKLMEKVSGRSLGEKSAE